MSSPWDERYGRYVACYELVKGAVNVGDSEALLQLELDREQSSADWKVASIAIHDVALHLPRRAASHFTRLLQENWEADNGYFIQLLESLRAKACGRR